MNQLTDLPPTALRVERSTEPEVQQAIDRQTEMNIRCYEGASVQEIDRRLEELDREWDIERALETNAAAVALTGLVLSITKSRKWLVLPFVVSGFLMQHALRGWCPPLPIFRRAGIRTAREIDIERTALRLMKGELTKASNADEAYRMTTGAPALRSAAAVATDPVVSAKA